MTTESSGSPDRDLLWKQYALHVDLYKFYLELTVKVNVFYYGITGSIVAYYVQHVSDATTRQALLLPIAFSLAIGAILLYGAGLLKLIRAEMFSIRDQLGLATSPDVQVLVVFLRVLGTIMMLTGCALTAEFLRVS